MDAKYGDKTSAHLIKISKLQDRALIIINFEDFNDNPSTLYKNEKIIKIQDLIKIEKYLT